MTPIWTDEAINAATRIICRGLPLDAPGQPHVPLEGRDLCVGPACDCWTIGRQLTHAALEAAADMMEIARYQDDKRQRRDG